MPEKSKLRILKPVRHKLVGSLVLNTRAVPYDFFLFEMHP
jgi:hypothetical protein